MGRGGVGEIDGDVEAGEVDDTLESDFEGFFLRSFFDNCNGDDLVSFGEDVKSPDSVVALVTSSIS